MILTVLVIATVYFIGVWIGKSYERSRIYGGSIGVILRTNKETRNVESITFYYTDEAYEDDVAQLREKGVPFYDNSQK